MTFPKFHYNDLSPTCCGLVGRVAKKSVTSWQLPRLRGNYAETCAMDFGHNWTVSCHVNVSPCFCGFISVAHTTLAYINCLQSLKYIRILYIRTIVRVHTVHVITVKPSQASVDAVSLKQSQATVTDRQTDRQTESPSRPVVPQPLSPFYYPSANVDIRFTVPQRIASYSWVYLVSWHRCKGLFTLRASTLMPWRVDARRRDASIEPSSIYVRTHSFIMFGSKCWIYEHWLHKI